MQVEAGVMTDEDKRRYRNDRARELRRLHDDIKNLDQKLEARLQMVKALEMRRAVALRRIAELEAV